MWVDNPLSLAGGREIYGYNKNQGLIELPGEGAAAGSLKVQAYGGNYGGGDPADWKPLIEVTPASPGPLQRGESKFGRPARASWSWSPCRTWIWRPRSSQTSCAWRARRSSS